MRHPFENNTQSIYVGLVLDRSNRGKKVGQVAVAGAKMRHLSGAAFVREILKPNCCSGGKVEARCGL